MSTWTALVFTTLVLADGPARAVDIDARDCSQDKDQDLVIRGCEAVLRRGAANSARDRAILHDNLGKAYYRKGDKPRAIAEFSRSLESDPTFADAYSNRGASYDALGDEDRALADDDRALALNPKLALAYNNRGFVYFRKGDFDRAIADYERAIASDPHYTLPRENLGAAHERKGERALAILDYGAEIAMDPHNAVPYSRRGEAYLYEGDFERAIADLTEAIAISPAIALNYSNRAEARARKGDLDGALADCDEARRRDPKEPLSHVYRAYVLGKTGRLAEADAELAEAFKLSPGEPDAILYRGELEMMEQAPGKALVDFEAALAKSPQNPFALSGRDAARRALEARPALSGDAAGIRVALVIGNAHYAAQAPLANPPNDASAIAEGLRGSGFQHVTVALDLTREGIVKALHEFQDEADKADWALVYFSGHGLEVGGVNYVLPVDAHVTSDRDVADEAISLDRLVAGVSGARKIKIVILDACRENPFAASMRRSAGTRSVTRGLAPIEPVGATLVVYAAKDGEVAQDGDGANSPFAAALAKHLAEPHLELTKLFRLVTADVLDATDRKQQPFVYGSVGRDDFYFRP